MIRSPSAAARRALVLAAVLVSGAACSKKESLVLLDLRASGPLGAPVAFVRLSSPGGKTRTISGAVGPEGFLVGYYGPVQDDAISVTAEALDGIYCALGKGSATVTDLESGATSAPTKLFIRPLPASGCARVAAAGVADTSDDSVMDAASETGNGDTSADGGSDAGAGDAASDATTDAGASDAAAD